MFAQILLFQKTGLNNDILTYEIPKEMPLEIGALVQVPLKKKSVRGIVIELTGKKNVPGIIRPIEKILHPQLLQKWHIELLNMLSENYHTPKSVIARHLLPSYLQDDKGVADEMIKDLAVKNIPTTSSEKSQKNDTTLFVTQKKEALEKYLNEIVKKYSDGQVAIIAPEIAIEPWWTATLETQYNALNYNTAKTPKQKAILWKEVFEGKHRVIYGSRNTLLAPFHDLRAIVVMNEHGIGHKEDQRPKFHTRDLAMQIQKLTRCDLHFMGSSISLPLWHALEEKKLQLPKPEKRQDTQFKIIDMRNERKRGNFSPLSEDLIKILAATLQHKSQAILFLNKRGESSCLLCRDCGYIPKCHMCQRNLIVQRHAEQGQILACIAGEVVESMPDACPRCGGVTLRMIGIGQEKIVSVLREHFPDARVAIYSKERAKTRTEQKKILRNFEKGEGDILITTQLLYSGAPIPAVPVVVALDIDTGLSAPHFMSGEKTVHHLQDMQSFLKPKGILLLQTHMPDNPLLTCYRENRLEEWYRQELKSRKTLNYPPYSRILVLTSTLRQHGKISLEKTLEYIKKTEPGLSIELAKKNIGHRDKYYLVIRGHDPEKAMSVIRKMPDVSLDIDSPYLT